MKKYLIFLILPLISLASGHDGPKDYDIVWRTINFVLFFGILYYLLKGPAKDAFKARIDSIAKRLETNQRILKESNEKKEQAKKDLEEAKAQGASLIETAKKEAVFAAEKVKAMSEQEIKNLNKTFAEQKDFETRRIEKEVVNEILDEVFAKDTMEFKQDKLLDIIEKKAV